MLGGEIGYNWQLGHLVLGLEADGSLGRLANTVRDGNYLTESGEISSLGTVRGRIGYAMGRWLPFVTGGFAWDRLKEGAQCPDPAAVVAGVCKNPAIAPFNLSSTETNNGWVIGGGLEYAIDNGWSVKAEGLRLDFNNQRYSIGKTPGGVTLPAFRIDHDLTLFRLGVNYRFQ